MFVRKVENLDAAREILNKHGVDPAGVEIMSKKMILRVIEIADLDIRAANILKQEALSCGADLALPKEACKFESEKTDGILIANLKQLQILQSKLLAQPFGLKDFALELRELLKVYDRDFGKPKIMGILNVTPDSFSDGGDYFDHEAAILRGLQMIEEGASIIDVGGESSGPGSVRVSEKEELKRVIPVIKGIRAKNAKVVISVDTYKSGVFKAALKAGANMLNDVTALRGDKAMVRLVAKENVPVCLMYSKDKTARTTRRKVHYDDVVAHILKFLKERADFAIKNGVKSENIIVDPGMGAFLSTDSKYSFEVLARLSEFKALGYPILIGPSRKSFLGGKLSERLFGTLAACTIAAMHGANILRVHDVTECAQALSVSQKL